MVFYHILAPLAWVVWHLAFRIQVIGRENLPKGGRYILAPNHISAIDPVFVIICRPFAKRMRIFAKKELLEKNALLTWFLKCMGCVAVRGSGKDELAVIDKTVEEVKNGGGLLIFPEGTRSKTGELLPMKSGAFVVAARAEAPMIPCRIIYDTPDKTMKLFCRCRVVFGKAIPAADLAMESSRDRAKLKANKQRLTEALEALYEQNRF